MKRSYFIGIFVGTHLLGVFLLIHKYSLIIEQTYRTQEFQAQEKALSSKKQLLMHQLYVAQQRSSVKKFAQEKLNMRDISLANIKHLPVLNPVSQLVRSSPCEGESFSKVETAHEQVI